MFSPVWFIISFLCSPLNRWREFGYHRRHKILHSSVQVTAHSAVTTSEQSPLPHYLLTITTSSAQSRSIRRAGGAVRSSISCSFRYPQLFLLLQNLSSKRIKTMSWRSIPTDSPFSILPLGSRCHHLLLLPSSYHPLFSIFDLGIVGGQGWCYRSLRGWEGQR